MNDLLRWLNGHDQTPGAWADVRWTWVTLTLSGLVVAGYVSIAVNAYFQSKVAGRAASRPAVRRLLAIVLCCGVCGVWFYASDMPWRTWRVYDAVLLCVALYTAWFALRMRGLDLVDQRLAQVNDLERSAEKYREIAELLPHLVWTATADGRVDFSNQRWAEYAGDARSWLDAVHPDERADALEWWRDTVASRGPATRELRLLGRRGEYRTFLVSATPVTRGAAVRWLGACADVEDQKLLAAEKETQAKRKTFFLNALGHDLRAPLNNVVLNAHLLKATARESDEAESANVILENAVAASELANKLLDFARADAFEHNADGPVSVAETVKQVTRRFLPVTEQKGLYLRVAGESNLEIVTDRQKLERVLSNLVDNAVKFTDRGGVEVGVEPREEGVAIRVSDTGPGVPSESAPYLFDEFYQARAHRRDPGKGFGMGLAICRSLARQLGGDVRLASTGPEGSSFELMLKGLSARAQGSAVAVPSQP